MIRYYTGGDIGVAVCRYASVCGILVSDWTYGAKSAG